MEPFFSPVLLSIACLKIFDVLFFLSDVQKAHGVIFDGGISAHGQPQQPPSYHIWALLQPLTLSSAAAVAGRSPPAGPGSLGLLLLSVCHISIAADTYLLRCHHISFSVFGAWQPLEEGREEGKEGKDLEIQSLQSEGKPVPSTEALWQLFLAFWHLPFNEMSPFVSSKSDSNQPACKWGHVPPMRKDCW